MGSLCIHCKQAAFYARLRIEKEMDTRGNVMLAQRQSIIVWLHSIKQAKMLRRFGNVHYV